MAFCRCYRIPASWLIPLLCFCFVLCPNAQGQQNNQTIGSVIGHLRLPRGGAPDEPVLVLLQIRGATMDSVYTDSQGTYGFHNLAPNPYRVVINDDRFQPEQRDAVIPPSTLMPVVFVDITLTPKPTPNNESKVPPKSSGANPNLTDVREYASKFPKPAVKEFEKGAKADAQGKKDDAIRHYQKAIEIAPDFYLAHNNLGSDYLSQSNFPAARKEFELAIQQNQSNAASYFNLSNACMLMNQLPDASKYLEEGIRREPESALGQFLLGSLNLKTGKLPEAERALRQSIKLDAVMTQPRLQLVNLLLQQGRKDEAVGQLQEFVKTFPDNPFAPQARKLLERLEPPSEAKSH
jgi:Tfp pilus assembly protein PilF